MTHFLFTLHYTEIVKSKWKQNSLTLRLVQKILVFFIPLKTAKFVQENQQQLRLLEKLWCYRKPIHFISLKQALFRNNTNPLLIIWKSVYPKKWYLVSGVFVFVRILKIRHMLVRLESEIPVCIPRAASWYQCDAFSTAKHL